MNIWLFVLRAPYRESEMEEKSTSPLTLKVLIRNKVFFIYSSSKSSYSKNVKEEKKFVYKLWNFKLFLCSSKMLF